MYTYNLCEFEYGYTGQFYQRADEQGNATYTDLSGNEITLEGEYGYLIIEVNVIPNWL
jgi:hypothetical protein